MSSYAREKFIIEYMRELISLDLMKNDYLIRHELLVGDDQLTITHKVNVYRLQDDPEVIGIYRLLSSEKFLHEIEKRELKFSDIRYLPLPDCYSPPCERIPAK